MCGYRSSKVFFNAQFFLAAYFPLPLGQPSRYKKTILHAYSSPLVTCFAIITRLPVYLRLLEWFIGTFQKLIITVKFFIGIRKPPEIEKLNENLNFPFKSNYLAFFILTALAPLACSMGMIIQPLFKHPREIYFLLRYYTNDLSCALFWCFKTPIKCHQRCLLSLFLHLSFYNIIITNFISCG